MRIFFLTFITLFFISSCGSQNQESDSNVSGEFISDAKTYLPPNPPGYEALNKSFKDNLK